MAPTVDLAGLRPELDVTVNQKKRTSTIIVRSGPYLWTSPPVAGIYNDQNARSYFRQFPDRFKGDGAAELAPTVARMFM